MKVMRNAADTAKGPDVRFSGHSPGARPAWHAHISLVEVDDSGESAVWGDHVTDDEYGD